MRRRWVPKLILTEKQWRAFVEEAKRVRQPWKALLLFLAFTGCRDSEVATIQWENISFESREALIWNSKYGVSRRVPLHPDLIEALREIGPKERGYVFPSSRREGHITTRAIRYQVKKIGRRIGVPNLYPHALRHTFASLLLARGVPAPVVRDILGHSSLAVTDIYSHAYPEQRKHAVLKLPL